MPSSAQSGAESSARSDGLPESRFAAMDENGFRSIQEEARLAAYGRLAAKKCDEAMEEASRRAEERKRTARPKHVWWGFHYFWPKEVLEGTAEKDALDDAEVSPALARAWPLPKPAHRFQLSWPGCGDRGS